MKIGIQVNRFNPAYKVLGDDYLNVVSRCGFQCVDFSLETGLIGIKDEVILKKYIAFLHDIACNIV